MMKHFNLFLSAILLIIGCICVKEADCSCNVVPTSQEPLKLLVPLYVYPGEAWDQVIQGASQVSTIAIINPSSGPASSPDGPYTTYMNNMKNANVEMVGYVYTTYGTRNINSVMADIDTYASKYPLLTGIFFDEASASSSELSFYSQAYNYAIQKGFQHVILNPGTQPDQGYFSVSTSIVVFENAGSTFNSQTYSVSCSSNAKYQYAAIAHSTDSSDASALLSSMESQGMGLVYVTDGAAGCCTYNQLVSYFSAEASTVHSLN